MVGNFLDTLVDNEKQQIKDKIGILIDLLKEWARRYPSLRPVIPMITLTTAVALPQASISDALAWAQAVAWIFLVDYKADPRTFTHKDMRLKAEQWHSMTSNWPTAGMDDGSELTTILADITSNMSKSCLFESLQEYWALRLRNHVLGVAQEFQNALEYGERGPRALPSLDEYLRVGVQSVGYPFLGSMAMIFHRDSSIIKHIELVSEILECAGAALRLYNDVATLDKEIQMGEVNSILVVYHTMLDRRPDVVKESVLSEAKQRVLHLADSYAHRCYDLVGQLKTDSGQFEMISYRLVALHAYFYGHTEQDYHTTSLAKVCQMLGDRTS